MKTKRANPTLGIVCTDAIYNQALLLLEDNVLALDGKDLQSYGLDMPQRSQEHTLSKEVLRETSYDLENLEQMVQLNEPRLTPDQCDVNLNILANVDSRQGGIMFLDAPGGTGKTFLLNLLLAKIRMQHCYCSGILRHCCDSLGWRPDSSLHLEVAAQPHSH